MTGVLDIDKFVATAFREGVISTLLGLPEGGKSNLASIFAEFLVPRGYHVYTNLGFFELSEVQEAMEKRKLAYVKNWKSWYRQKPPEIHTVRSLSDLFIGLLSTEPNVTILDEAGIHASSTRATSKDVSAWKNIAFIIRHLSSAFLLVAQSKGSVVPDLRQTLVQIEMKIRKLNKRNRVFTIGTAVGVVDEFTGEETVKFEVAEGDEYHFTPLTCYPYDGKDFPFFDMDLDLRETYKRLSLAGNSLQIRKNNLGVRVIEELIKEKMKKTGKIGGYLKVGAFAKKYGLHPHTIRKYCKENKLKHYVTKSGYTMVFDSPP